MNLSTPYISSSAHPEHIDISMYNGEIEVFSGFTFIYSLNERKLLYSSEQLGKELGYTENELKSRDFNILDIVHSEDAAVFKNALLQLEEKGADNLMDIQCHFRKSDGTYNNYRITYRKCKKEEMSDFENCAVLTSINVSMHNEGLSELNELLRIRKLTEKQLKFGTFEYDFICDKAKWSDGLYELFGYKDEQPVMTFEKLASHFTDISPEDFWEKIQYYIDNRQEYVEEYNIVSATGERKVIEVRGRKVYNEKGEVLKDIGIMRDVTYKKVQEETINKFIEELQRSNRELEDFAYIASHDMQEPLRKISTFSTRLSEKFGKELGEEGNLYVERIVASAQNMRMLIENLLDFSRISRVKQPKINVNLNFILQQVKTDLELVVEETGTQIRNNELPIVEASLSQMKQMFYNIINNAIKFRKAGVPPVIEIKSVLLSGDEAIKHSLPVGKRHHKIEIQDNGIGFEEEYATRIFQIFQRLHGKSEYPGSGIGLAICKKIADEHQGVIYATNVPDKGSRFTIILPEKQT